MRHKKSLLLLVFLLIAGLALGSQNAAARPHPVPAASTAVAIDFGDTLSGSISSPAEVDTFTFVAAPGAKVLIAISKTSGDLWPGIRLYGPGGDLLVSEEAPTHAEVVMTLPAAGTYSILVSDGLNATQTGGYNLYLQRLDAPAGAGPIAFGATASGSISKAAEMDAFTFSAADGDIVLIGISKTSGDVWPEIRLYDSNGNLLQSDSSPTHAEMTVTLSAMKLVFLPIVIKPALAANAGVDFKPGNRAAPGQTLSQYTILVGDGFNGTLTGSYNLYLQRLNDPAGAIPIAFGEIKSGSVSLAAEMDVFTFTANQGDTVLLGISKTSGDVWPEIRLYDPDVNLLQTEGAPTHAEMTVTLPASGTYLILVADGFNGTLTGSYNLFLQRLNDPTGAIPITFGETNSGSVSLAAEMDVFTFTANQGDTVLIGISKTSGDVWPEIRLYDPDANLLQTQGAPTHAEMTVTLPASGTYLVLVADGFNGTLTGSYNLYLQRLNDPTGAVPITLGETRSGSVSLAAEMDTFTFTANQDDAVLLGISKTSGDVWPEIRLYDPDVNLLGTDSGPSSVEMTVTLPASGTYLVLVADGFNGTLTGSYELNLQATLQ